MRRQTLSVSRGSPSQAVHDTEQAARKTHLDLERIGLLDLLLPSPLPALLSRLRLRLVLRPRALGGGLLLLPLGALFSRAGEMDGRLPLAPPRGDGGSSTTATTVPSTWPPSM